MLLLVLETLLRFAADSFLLSASYFKRAQMFPLIDPIVSKSLAESVRI